MATIGHIWGSQNIKNIMKVIDHMTLNLKKDLRIHTDT